MEHLFRQSQRQSSTHFRNVLDQKAVLWSDRNQCRSWPCSRGLPDASRVELTGGLHIPACIVTDVTVTAFRDAFTLITHR